MRTQQSRIDELQKMIYSLKRAIKLKSSVSSHYASYKNQEIALLLDLNTISSPLDWAKVHNLQTTLLTIQQNNKLSAQFKRSYWLKFYVQVLVACIVEGNQVQGFLFLQKLVAMIRSNRDIQEVVYSLFQINSLNAVLNYQVDQNKEYKYDPITQALFFFMLSRMSCDNQRYFQDKCLQICEKFQQCQRIHPIISKTIQGIKDGKRSVLIEKLLNRLIKIQRDFVAKQKNQNNIQLDIKQSIEVYSNQKFKFSINNYNEKIRLGKYKRKQQILINVLQLTNNQYNPLILKHLQSTSLFRKINLHAQSKLQQQQLSIRNKENVYEKRQLLQSFKLCQQGMRILKCNYGNFTISPRFVYLNQEGIFWGKQRQDCKLKRTCWFITDEWCQFKGILYGRVTSNVQKKAKVHDCPNIFSIVLQDRSVDFICSNYPQTIVWLQGLAYFVNQLQNKPNFTNSKSNRIEGALTKGQIIWKRLMMKVRREGQIGQGKARGVIALKDKINLRRLNIFMHEF